MSFIIGLDVGGTSVKGIIFKDGKAVCKDSLPTVSGEGLADCLFALSERLAAAAGTQISRISGVGVGCPGVIDAVDGTVVRANNLGLFDYPLKSLLKERVAEVRVCNDGNAAALGEAYYGAGRGYKNSVLITLGTGVGGGIIIDGKLFSGNRSAGAEIGHMVIKEGGKLCSCGRRGCFEAYCSARALAGLTRSRMRRDPLSPMWREYNLRTADGETAFKYAGTDPSAAKVVETYIGHLVCGIANLANIFRPEAVILGGGVSAQGERLERLVRERIKKEIFAFGYAPVEIKCASLKNDAGAYGAAALFTIPSAGGKL